MGGFRRFIIKTAEVVMVLFVILTTVALAIGGAVGSEQYGGAYAIVGFIIGGILGFVFASIVAAFFFLLAEIAENTRSELLLHERPGVRP
jgi:hypothetical protein